MAIEDIKGYKPHTDQKIELVNTIKEAEKNLGQIFKDITEKLSDEYQNLESQEELDDTLERMHQIQKAVDHLKEASMWACRAVFRPDEAY